MSREAVTVEFVGTPGAGKTTLASDLVRALRCRGVVADTIVSAARPRAARTRVGAMISRLPESSLRRVLLWYVFTTASVGHAIGFACRHPALVLHVARILRFGDSYARRTRAHIWFFRLCGRLRFLTSTARPGEVLVVDDGFLHRSVHFYADPDRAPNLGAVRRYAELVPRSTLSIHVDADVTTCLARVRARGVWDHARHLDDADLRRYLTRADFVVRAATGRVRH